LTHFPSILFLIPAVAIFLDIVASFHVVRSDIHSGSQKALQLVLTWAIPFLGSILVLSVLAQHRKSDLGYQTLNGSSWTPGTGPEGNESHHHEERGD
jgi:hypothetical protein